MTDKLKNQDKSYCVDYEDIKHEINAGSLDDFIMKIKDMYKIAKDKDIFLQFWSEKYAEWIHIDELPLENSKIKVSTQKISK